MIALGPNRQNIAGLFAILAALFTLFLGPAQAGREHVSKDQVARQVVKIIERDRELCSEIPLQYRLDCLQYQLKSVRNKIRSEQGFREAGKIFSQAQKKIDAIVKENLDPKMKTIRVKGRKLRAIKASSVKKAERQMRAVLKETTTLLLRSNSKTAVQYQIIAAAVDSNKLLLRS